MLIFKGVLNNIYKKADYEDKKTGEVNLGKWQLEFITQREVNKGEGYQTVLEKISIPKERYKEFANQVGNEVEVQVQAMVNNKSVILYGV